MTAQQLKRRRQQRYRESHRAELACKSRLYAIANRAQIQAQRAAYRQENRARLAERSREFYQNHPEIRAAYIERNKDKIAEYLERTRSVRLIKKARYNEATTAKRRSYDLRNTARRNKYLRDRRRSDLHFKIVANLRKRVAEAIRKCIGAKKHRRTLALTGCSIDDLKSHLESQFTDGMGWENYGEWHIDHKVPCVRFDLRNAEQQEKCFHWTNLGPLWAVDNLRKGARMPGPQTASTTEATPHA